MMATVIWSHQQGEFKALALLFFEGRKPAAHDLASISANFFRVACNRSMMIADMRFIIS